MESEKKPSRRGLVIGIAVVVVFLLMLVAVVFWALNRSGPSTQDGPALRTAYESAMRKAGVQASYPPEPVDLTSIVASGKHPFSATFTAEELGALLSTFRYSASIDGTTIVLRRTSLRIPADDTVSLDASVDVEGSTYSMSIDGPVSFVDGAVKSPNATRVTASGISLNAGQRAQATRAVVSYVNSYLEAAPGLDIESVTLTTAGAAVTGTAPDRIEFP